MEALQAFDNEKLVRALADFPIPVIAAIGHHQDVPLAALTADLHVSTPTAAANLLNQPWQQASFRVDRDAERVSATFRGILARAEQALDLSYYFERADALRSAFAEDVAYAAKRITASFDGLLRFAAMRLESTGRVIAANDPARNLRLGYAMIRRHGKIVKRAADLRPGSEFEVQFSDGAVAAQAVEKEKKTII